MTLEQYFTEHADAYINLWRDNAGAWQAELYSGEEVTEWSNEDGSPVIETEGSRPEFALERLMSAMLRLENVPVANDDDEYDYGDDTTPSSDGRAGGDEVSE